MVCISLYEWESSFIFFQVILKHNALTIYYTNPCLPKVKVVCLQFLIHNEEEQGWTTQYKKLTFQENNWKRYGGCVLHDAWRLWDVYFFLVHPSWNPHWCALLWSSIMIEASFSTLNLSSCVHAFFYVVTTQSFQYWNSASRDLMTWKCDVSQSFEIS